MRVNRSELAEVLGLSLPSVDNRIRRGMPYVEKPNNGSGGWVFETSDVINWLIEQASESSQSEETQDSNQLSAKELQRRKLQAETEMAEIELAKKKDLVVLVEDVVAEFADAVANLRAQLLNYPRRVAPLIVGETDVDVVKETLDREVNELLQELHEDALRGAEELKEGD